MMKFTILAVVLVSLSLAQGAVNPTVRPTTKAIEKPVLAIEKSEGVSTQDETKGVATQDEAEGVATQDEAEGVATQDEAEGVATQDEAKGVATQDEVEGVATQDEPEGVVTQEEEDIADIQNAEEEFEYLEAPCTDGEFQVDRRNCRRFYVCSNGELIRKWCPGGLYFNGEAKVCDYPSRVYCPFDRCDRRRVGRLSGTGDDDESVTTCPRDTVPVQCVASNPRRSDGTIVSGRTCTAVNSRGGNGQRAIATCISLPQDNFVFVTSGDFEQQPRADCPGGTFIVSCNLRNAWAHVRYAFPRMLIAGNACVTDSPCTAGRGCFVQAVCRRRINLEIEA